MKIFLIYWHKRIVVDEVVLEETMIFVRDRGKCPYIFVFQKKVG